MDDTHKRDIEARSSEAHAALTQARWSLSSARTSGGSMTPHSFDIDTAKEIVGDTRMRTIEAKARADADNGVNDPPAMGAGSYWSQVSAEMDFQVYATAHAKRLARSQRMAKKKGST